jgi:type IV pilus assembly protein PilV
MTTFPIQAGRRHAGGFALMEVLIAVVVLAFGLLGLAAMLMTSQKSNSSSYARQLAVQTAYDIIDRMRVNGAGTYAGNYAFSNLTTSGAAAASATPGVDCNSTSCSASELAAFDLNYWSAYDLKQLPNGSGAVSAVTATGAGINLSTVTVTVQWDDGPAQARLGAATTTATATPNLARFVAQTVIQSVNGAP